MDKVSQSITGNTWTRSVRVGVIGNTWTRSIRVSVIGNTWTRSVRVSQETHGQGQSE
jgi:hypothetical protein